MNRLEIIENKLVKGCHTAISLMNYRNDKEKPGLIYVNLTSFELQCHKLVKFRDENDFIY